MTFPPPLPPAYKKGKGHAREVGTWVTGMNGHGLHGIPDHKGHVLAIKSLPYALGPGTNSGYRQDVLCVECGDNIAMVDGEFLQIKFGRQALTVAIERLQSEIARKQTVLRRAKEKSYE